MTAQFSCRNILCEKHAVVVNLEVQLGEGMFEGRYMIWGDDVCGACGKSMEPVVPARELAARQRSE